MCISSVGSFPVWSGGSQTIFQVYLGVGNLALNSANVLYVLGVAIGFCLIGQVYTELTCLSVCPYIPSGWSDICMFMSTFVHLSVHLYIHQYYFE